MKAVSQPKKTVRIVHLISNSKEKMLVRYKLTYIKITPFQQSLTYGQSIICTHHIKITDKRNPWLFPLL